MLYSAATNPKSLARNLFIYLCILNQVGERSISKRLSNILLKKGDDKKINSILRFISSTDLIEI